MSDNPTPVGGIGFFGVLGIAFICLKLAHVINWSWWLITLPLWGGMALFVVLAAIVVAVALASSRTKKPGR